jgi:hypothetical protein
MLTIRREQMKAFEISRRAGFARAIGESIECSLREMGRGNECVELDAAIHHRMEEAQRFGLTRESEVARFVETTILHLGVSWKKDLPKPALAILLSYGLDPSVKLERFRTWVREESRKRSETHAIL